MNDHAPPDHAPLVSVITPTYNRARYLPEAIESVLAQTYDRFEHWIVDDGSTDATPDVVARYRSDPRIRYLRHEENRGQSHARNTAIARAGGEFICFLDSDDRWFPEKLARSLEAFARHPDTDVVYGDYVFIDGEGEVLAIRNMRRHSGRIVGHMLRDNCVSMNTTMARRRCFDELGGFSGRRAVADDYDLWLRFSAYYRFLYIPEKLGCYRIMDDQISSDKTGRFEVNEAIIRDFLAEHGHRVAPAEARTGRAHFLTRRGRHLAREGQRFQALNCYSRALALTPLSRGPWRALAKLLLRGTG